MQREPPQVTENPQDRRDFHVRVVNSILWFNVPFVPLKICPSKLKIHLLNKLDR